MNQSREFIQPQNLTRIQSKAFQIYLVNIKDRNYFGYFPKQEYLHNPQLGEFLNGDLQPQNEIKYLRKFNKSMSQGFYAFEAYKEYTILSDLKQLQEQIILKIFQDLLIALYGIHQRGLLGRCFNVNNIILVENQHCVMMEYGFYPDLEFQVPEYTYNQIYNDKIDIFLLGRVIFYLMVGNDLPEFNINNLGEISSDINLSIAQTGYSENLKKLVISMLSIDLNRRIDYSQLFAKFKNNQFYSLQEQFYKANTLRNTTQRLIEKREKMNDKFDQSGAFDIQMTQQFKKTIEDQFQIASQPIIFEKNSQSDISQAVSQSISSLYPPDVNSSQQYKQLSQDKIVSKVNDNTRLATTQYNTEEAKIKSTLMENDLLLSVLPFLNADRPQDILVWNQIYFYLYRFSLMTKLIEQLQQNLQKNNNFLITIAIYGMKKAQIILKREYQNSLESCQNLYNVPENEWQRFCQSSDEYKKMIGKIKQDIEINQKLLFQKDYIQLKKTLEINKNDGLLKDLYKFIEKYLDDQNSEISNFEEIKRSYRYILTNILSLFDQQDDKNNPYTRLLILMCILINRICDVQSIPQHFKTVCQFLKTNSISSIVQIEQFLRKATNKEFIEQFDELKLTYFSG